MLFIIMYVVVDLQGHQYIVKKGSEIQVDRMSLSEGESFVHDKVLCVFDEKGATVGQPLVPNASVSFTVKGEGKGKKIYVIKFKRKKRYERRQGFRSYYTTLLVDDIKTNV